MTDPSPTLCIFCRIAKGDIPATVVLETDELVAFRDLAPQGPTHVLIIPKRHIRSTAHAEDRDAELLGRLLLAARDVARDEGLADDGYRIVTNVGSDGGQSVAHLHLHLIGGRPMSWPPG